VPGDGLPVPGRGERDVAGVQQDVQGLAGQVIRGPGAGLPVLLAQPGPRELTRASGARTSVNELAARDSPIPARAV
jgi:hypothetical protein